MPGSVGAVRRSSDVRRSRQPHQSWQRPRDRKSGRSDRLGRVAVDVPDLDLALPHNAAGLDEGAYDTAAQASAADATVCWDTVRCEAACRSSSDLSRETASAVMGVLSETANADLPTVEWVTGGAKVCSTSKRDHSRTGRHPPNAALLHQLTRLPAP